ncbi:hypothetical protein FB567DRAFT_512214 [Paraphoma chrysanthemicola]|uniref:Uncharacterized protein n=1 Tax=Paraphoma chrysanthemicola TaxID=798071 RepID=A0A8K0RK20_9PLEO|nr:hypothetical protein FB567DRAFT_512214 [Paraphoma chrysanthemicola]
MAANSYYNGPSHNLYEHDHDQQHLLSPNLSSGQPSPLKPLHILSHNQSPAYHHAPAFEDFEPLKEASHEDTLLKRRIRIFRVVSRILSFALSIAVLIPITLTLVKFLRTKDTYRTIPAPAGQSTTRTPWARNTRAWPTWMYFAVAVVSVFLNGGTVLSYKSGVGKANTASYVASGFGWVIGGGNLVVWSVAAGMYRGEKDKDGKSNDLWGWTCSAGARAIQKEFAKDVDFGMYCNVQSVSWYIGLAQAGAALLTVVIYVMVFMRRRSKRRVQELGRLSGFEPSRR